MQKNDDFMNCILTLLKNNKKILNICWQDIMMYIRVVEFLDAGSFMFMKVNTQKEGFIISIRIIVASDICPSVKDSEFFIEGKVDELFGDLLPLFQAADIAIANLESTLCENMNPVKKIGPNFSANPHCLNAIKKANINYLSLANNHIKDYGEEGIISTLKACNDYGIETVGLGNNISIASKPMIITAGNKKIGIISAAENEGELASDYEAGANPIDCFEIARTIYNDLNKCDAKIIILHGGREFFRYPSPRMKKISHNLIDAGASCVLWQHSHCTSGTEYYKNGFISYGQGNFIFNYAINYRNFFRGYLVQIDIDDNNETYYNLVPYYQHYYSNGTNKMKGEDLLKFNEEIDELNKVIHNNVALSHKWDKFCKGVVDNYLSELFCNDKAFERLDIVSNIELDKKLFLQYGVNENEVLKFINMIGNETHSDVLLNVLHIYLSSFNNKEQ